MRAKIISLKYLFVKIYFLIRRMYKEQRTK